ncbi:MAG: FAD-binding domain-containing protein [Pseudomonadota bacterium]
MGEDLDRGQILLGEMQARLMSDQRTLPGFAEQSEHPAFVPSRASGLSRLDRFVARAGRHYASNRNYDYGPEKRGNVSCLSPWVRHRLVTEEDVLRAVLARHAPSTAEKFIQEVFWRTYFKGWLEQRPSVWTAYQNGVAQGLRALEKDRVMAIDYEGAIEGRSGIDGFDQWARELVATGYLHNHARMWFASIWIFTLRLPWELGADFFLRHLIDGDPASNTLSWRWVAGLHTKGKTYQARASNIAKYTEGRFRPEHQLSGSAEPLIEEIEHSRQPIPIADVLDKNDFLLLVTEEDGSIDAQLPRAPAAVLGLLATKARSPLLIGAVAQAFADGAVNDAVDRIGAPSRMVRSAEDWSISILDAAKAAGVSTVVTSYAPVGPVASRLKAAAPVLRDAQITLKQVRRSYDDLAWPHATKGFFALKQKIPQVLQGLGLAG